MKFISKANDSIWTLIRPPLTESIESVVKIAPLNRVGGVNVRHTIVISVKNLIDKYTPLGAGAREFLAKYEEAK